MFLFNSVSANHKNVDENGNMVHAIKDHCFLFIHISTRQFYLYIKATCMLFWNATKSTTIQLNYIKTSRSYIYIYTYKQLWLKSDKADQYYNQPVADNIDVII
jgi:hypothetical protein